MNAQTNSGEIWLAYNAAENRRDFAAMFELISTELAVTVNGKQALSSAEADAEAMRTLLNTYPDYRREVDQIISTGDFVTARWRMLGTAIPGSGRANLSVAGCSIVRCESGVLTEAFLYYDGAALDAVLAEGSTLP